MIYLQVFQKKITCNTVKKTLLTILTTLCCIICAGQVQYVTTFDHDSIRVEYKKTLIFPVDTVTVTIIGDVMLHQSQIDNSYSRYRRRAGTANPLTDSCYDFSPYFRGIRNTLTEADICVANMEFTHAGPPFSGYPAFCAPDSYSEYAADCGVDVFLTANNHIFDRGTAGAKRTLEVYENMKGRGILNTGCYASGTAMEESYPLFVECRGMRIALVNFTYGTNVELEGEWPKVSSMDKEEIAAALLTARHEADIVIALPHWGIEYDLQHSAEQEEIAYFLAKHGADAIIGGHPHVVQDVDHYEVFPDKKMPLVYSLGNIISNMSAENTQVGLIVTLPLVRLSDGSSRVGEPRYTLTWCSLPGRLTDSHATIAIKDYIGRRDEWIDPSDYDKMIRTYERIKTTSGIQE